MTPKRFYLTLVLLLATGCFAWADAITINHFIIKDNPFGQSQVAIVATDSADVVQENVNGIFTFAVNGFEQPLTFTKGVAFYSPKIEKSIFLYIRHNNDTGTHAKLYYVYKSNDKLLPLHIGWGWLLVIPLSLVLLGYLFKRFIIIAIIIFLIFIYFNHHSGLNLHTFFESILDGLKTMF
ncbi:hypothetical protein HQ865_06930 [Mucilaginibacter mali]|uniref:Uncharacterized protein n=1 Tax=Mucilaginibacter mali TaxID=2740462 RepID=A0A7D4U9Y4_9SPHI|nr:hypothetical protein [Mucilaginibacter mali]QKJ29498.1 hypothetical protein HQ865_06930 [Mucilaginibacter mali]